MFIPTDRRDFLRRAEESDDRPKSDVMDALRKRVLKHLRTAGLSPRQCDELIEDLDVRDLDLNLSAKLRQETPAPAFYNKDGSAS